MHVFRSRTSNDLYALRCSPESGDQITCVASACNTEREMGTWEKALHAADHDAASRSAVIPRTYTFSAHAHTLSFFPLAGVRAAVVGDAAW